MMRKVLFMSVAAAALSAGSSAFAAVVCNSDGDCWRVKETRAYKPEFNLRVYPDSWRWADHERDHYRWREPGRGHGYYRNGVWVEIR